MFDPEKEAQEDGHWTMEEGQENLIHLIEADMTLGDHSYDHMFHNNNSGNDGVYIDVDQDLTYFGARNFENVQMLMEEAGIHRDIRKRVSFIRG